MNCPYCVMTVHPDEQYEYRGPWCVHKVCQLKHERLGTYLLPGGCLRVNNNPDPDHTYGPRETEKIFQEIRIARYAEHDEIDKRRLERKRA